jgi:signal transduction histidine kinase
LHNDPERVKQALLNLLSNALKYTQSGSIRIEATLVEKDQIAVAVCDTGIGITKQDKEAFE